MEINKGTLDDGSISKNFQNFPITRRVIILFSMFTLPFHLSRKFIYFAKSHPLLPSFHNFKTRSSRKTEEITPNGRRRKGKSWLNLGPREGMDVESPIRNDFTIRGDTRLDATPDDFRAKMAIII